MLFASGRRRRLAPQLVDQQLGRDYLVGVQQQHRQQRPLLTPAEREGTVVLGHLQWAEEPEFHGQETGRADRTSPLRAQASTGRRSGRERAGDSQHPHGHSAARTRLEGVGGLATHAQPDPVRATGAARREVVRVAEPATAAGAHGGERPPAAADAGLQLDQLARARHVAAEQPAGEAHRAAAAHGARRRVQPGAGRRSDHGRAARGEEYGVAGERHTQLARGTGGQPDLDTSRRIGAQRATGGGRHHDRALRAHAAPAHPPAQAPRERHLAAAERLRARHQPRAQQTAGTTHRERRPAAQRKRQRRRRAIDPARADRRVARHVRDERAQLVGAGAERSVVATRRQSAPARRSSIRPRAIPDVRSATTTRTRRGSAGSGASKATVSGGVRSNFTVTAYAAETLPAPSIARYETVWRPSSATSTEPASPCALASSPSSTLQASERTPERPGWSRPRSRRRTGTRDQPSGAPSASATGRERSSLSVVRTAVPSTPAPDTALTSTGVPPSGSSSNGTLLATTASRPPIRTR